MSNKLIKPQPTTRTAYDYHECRDYLQKKYKYNERDYAKKFVTGSTMGEPYQDFWHWVVDHNDISNGCLITFSRETLNNPDFDGDQWVKTIYGYYLTEFADDNGELLMWVWW